MHSKVHLLGRMTSLRLGLLTALFAVTLSILSAPPTTAQPDLTAKVALHATHLTGGEHSGQYAGLALSADLSHLWYVFVGAGYLRSVGRDIELVAVNRYDWRDRHHLVFDFGLGTNLLRLDTGRLHHRIGPSLNVSYRHRREELAGPRFLPAYFESLYPEELEEALAICGTSSNVYCLYYEGSEQVREGQYVMITRESREHDVGLALALNYRLFFQNVEVSAEMGHTRYRKQGEELGGTHTYFYGISVGYRF